MSTVRGQAFARIEQLLLGVDGVQLVEVMPSGDPDAFPAFALFDLGQFKIEDEVGSVRYGLRVKIEGYVEGGSGPVAHQALCDLYAAAIIAIMSDEQLGGLSELIDEGDLDVTVAKLASQKRFAFALELTVQIATDRANPTQLA